MGTRNAGNGPGRPGDSDGRSRFRACKLTESQVVVLAGLQVKERLTAVARVLESTLEVVRPKGLEVLLSKPALGNLP